MAISIPPKDRPEWAKIISGDIEHPYRNYVLQTKIHQLHKEIGYKKITMNQAVDDLYSLCLKYALAVQPDFKQIFKTW